MFECKICGLRLGAALHHSNAAKQIRGLPFCVALFLTGEIFSISRYNYYVSAVSYLVLIKCEVSRQHSMLKKQRSFSNFLLLTKPS